MRKKPTRNAMIASAMIVCVVALSTQVIAAASTRDQSPASTTRDAGDGAPVTATAPAESTRSLGRSDYVSLGLAVLAICLIVATRWQRLDRAPKRPVVFSPPSALLLLGGMFLLAPIGSALAQTILGIKSPDGAADAALSNDDLAKLILAGTAARGLGVAAYAVLQVQARPPHPDRRAGLVVSAMIGTAGLLLTWPLVLASVSLAGFIVGAPREEIAHDTLRQLATAPVSGWPLAMMLMVVIAGPIIEEVMYRGLLQEAFRRAGATSWHAIMLSSVLFACAHIAIVQPHALIGLFMLSLGLGWSYEKTGRLWAPITMHALFNLANLVAARMDS